MTLELTEILFIGIWSLIGSILGFFAFTNDPDKTPKERFKRCLLSIGIGLFLAFPITSYLEETKSFSHNLNIMFGGLGAFGLPDFILKYWPKLSNSLVNIIVSKTEDIVNIDSNNNNNNNNDDDNHYSRFNNMRDD